MENSRTVIKEHPGIRQNYHNMPDRAGYNRVCVRSRNGDHIRLTYTRQWEPVSATVNHKNRIKTTGYNQDPDYFEDLEQQIAEGLIAADLVTAARQKEQQAERQPLALEQAAQQREREEKLTKQARSGSGAKKSKAKKTSRGQCTLSEPFAVQRVTA